jgi:hypothetical protein
MLGFSPDLAGATTIRNFDLPRTQFFHPKFNIYDSPGFQKRSFRGCIVLVERTAAELSNWWGMSREHVLRRGHQHHPPCHPTLPVISINCVLN